MEVKNIDIDKYLSTTFYDPSPHRFSGNEKPISERKLHVVYTCENCDYSISFKTDDFKKHNELNHSNLEPTDKKAIDKTLKAFHLKDSSFLDFYCPKCKQATTILFTGGPSGYWGEFTFNISHVFVTKPTLENGKAKFITKIKKMLRISHRNFESEVSKTRYKKQ